MVGEDVPGLVGEQCSLVLGVEQLHEPRVDHHDRFLGADRQRVVDRRNRRHIKVRDGRQVERGVGSRVCVPDVGELVLAESNRRAQVVLAQRPLVAELDQLAHHRVEVGNRLQRRGRGAVGGMLV